MLTSFDTCAGCGASDLVVPIAGVKVCWGCLVEAQRSLAIARHGVDRRIARCRPCSGIGWVLA